MSARESSIQNKGKNTDPLLPSDTKSDGYGSEGDIKVEVVSGKYTSAAGLCEALKRSFPRTGMLCWAGGGIPESISPIYSFAKELAGTAEDSLLDFNPKTNPNSIKARLYKTTVMHLKQFGFTATMQHSSQGDFLQYAIGTFAGEEDKYFIHLANQCLRKCKTVDIDDLFNLNPPAVPMAKSPQVSARSPVRVLSDTKAKREQLLQAQSPILNEVCEVLAKFNLEEKDSSIVALSFEDIYLIESRLTQLTSEIKAVANATDMMSLGGATDSLGWHAPSIKAIKTIVKFGMALRNKVLDDCIKLSEEGVYKLEPMKESYLVQCALDKGRRLYEALFVFQPPIEPCDALNDQINGFDSGEGRVKGVQEKINDALSLIAKKIITEAGPLNTKKPKPAVLKQYLWLHIAVVKFAGQKQGAKLVKNYKIDLKENAKYIYKGLKNMHVVIDAGLKRQAEKAHASGSDTDTPEPRKLDMGS